MGCRSCPCRSSTVKTELRVPGGEGSAEFGAIFQRPDGALASLVLGHGAGAGMRHPFMEALAAELERGGVATFRYQFPFMEAGQRRPDPRPVLLGAVRAAVETAAGLAKDLPLFAGGKSMGGRMSSLATAEEMVSVHGIVFFGFPLHPAGKPAIERSDHLARVQVPMLFLQGSRDALCDLPLLAPVISRVGARAELHVIEGADHGFHILKRSGRTDADVLSELAERTCSWVHRVLGLGDESV